MDALISIYETVLVNDWTLSGMKLTLIIILCILIDKCLKIIREGIANAYWED